MLVKQDQTRHFQTFIFNNFEQAYLYIHNLHDARKKGLNIAKKSCSFFLTLIITI